MKVCFAMAAGLAVLQILSAVWSFFRRSKRFRRVPWYLAGGYLAVALITWLKGKKDGRKAEAVVHSAYDTPADSTGKWLGLASWAVLAVCALGGVYLSQNGPEQVTAVDRGEAGAESQSYTWLVEDENGETVAVEVQVAAREYTADELAEIFEKARTDIEAVLFADGETAECVRHNLTFPRQAADGLVTLTWTTGDIRLISYEGIVHADKADEEGSLTWVRAEMVCGGNSADTMWYVCVYPPEETEEEAWTAGLRSSLEEAEKNSRTEGQFILPTEYLGKELTFETSKETVPAEAFLLMALAAGVLVYRSQERQEEERKKAIRYQMEADFPEILMKETVLLGAGLTVYGAWERIVQGYLKNRKDRGIRHAYEEMARTLTRIENGVPEGEAYLEYGRRTGLHSYRKMGSLLEQSVRTGSKGLAKQLEEETREAMDGQRTAARRRGEEAGTKLMAPMFLMLFVVVLLAVVPAMQEMKL